jgi:alpha-glucosidase
VTVEAQRDDPGSTLSFYRRALEVRRSFADTAGEEVELLSVDDDVLAFRRGDIVCHLNCGRTPVDVPEGEVLLSSGPTPGAPDTATWLRSR